MQTKKYLQRMHQKYQETKNYSQAHADNKNKLIKQ